MPPSPSPFSVKDGKSERRRCSVPLPPVVYGEKVPAGDEGLRCAGVSKPQPPSAVFTAAAASPPSKVVTPSSHGSATSGCFLR